MLKLISWFLKHKLIIMTLIGVTIGISSGMSLKRSGKWSQRDITYIKFPGEIFIRVVNCLIVPLITSSIISATYNLIRSGPIGLMAIYYYLTTTTIGITLGVVLVETIRPGESIKNEKVETPPLTKNLMIDTFLDLFRNLLPENLIEACMYQYQTVLEQPDNTSVPIEEWPITNEYVAGTNVIGLVFQSLILGLAIGKIGAKGKPLSDLFNSLSDIMMKIMKWITLMAPVGVTFLIAGRMLEIDDFSDIIHHFGLYLVTVFTGLILQGFIILPFIHWIITHKSPYKIIYKLGPAFATAIGTSSSSATIPYTMKSLEDLGINPKITKFIIPIGAATNMDGIALYEAISAIFIIQLRGLQFPLLKIIIVSITCTLSCVGAAGIPSGGYSMLIVVLNSIGVPIEDVAMIIAVDWIIDRFRTIINVIEDALGASIIFHFSKKHLEQELEDEMYPLETNIGDTPMKVHFYNEN
ncbi:hypothetical protein PUN28_009439 [Cardiocondyla obscurior]|uniref:Amino acid transporter n=1 Tax=Cardiocondyla obscurior TaxID=286306 RepID=A0AAW2FU96_9HYME